MEKEKEEADVKVSEKPMPDLINDPPAKPVSSESKTMGEKEESPKESAAEKEDSPKQDEEEESLGVEEMVSGLATTASGWFSGWMKSLEVAKGKSAEVYGMVKKDLSEFSEAVQAETSALVSETGSMLQSTSRTIKDSLQLQDEASTAGQVKKSVSGFLSHVQKAFTPDTMQDDDTEAYILQDGQPVLLDRLQTELYRLAADPQTFLADIPEAELVRYEIWSADVDLDSRQTELSDLLASNKTMLEQYTKLVPAQVSHANFWYRYLFHVHLAEERDKQREFLRKRAEQMTTPGAAEKQVAWEEEDFSDHVDVTDAQADRLLEEYDKEVRQRSSPPASKGTSAAASSGATGATAGTAKGTDDRPGTGTHSPEERVSSNDDDWVKEDLKDLKEELETMETNSNVSNDWEKWE